MHEFVRWVLTFHIRVIGNESPGVFVRILCMIFVLCSGYINKCFIFCGVLLFLALYFYWEYMFIIS